MSVNIWKREIMNLEIRKASIQDKTIIQNLLELYIYDFTEFGQYYVNENGLFGYKDLDLYWEEEGRDPYLIVVDQKLAGFALIHSEKNSEGEMVHAVSEFFVMKLYRGKGIGKEVAFYLFDQYPGLWEVYQMKTNIPTQFFWRSAIKAYTQDNYEEIQIENWNGPAQRFRTN